LISSFVTLARILHINRRNTINIVCLHDFVCLVFKEQFIMSEATFVIISTLYYNVNIIFYFYQSPLAIKIRLLKATFVIISNLYRYVNIIFNSFSITFNNQNLLSKATSL